MELQASPLGLGWGRAPDGRFFIVVAVGAVPIHSFILTTEEEASLRAAMAGIVMAELPPANGNGNNVLRFPVA